MLFEISFQNRFASTVPVPRHETNCLSQGKATQTGTRNPGVLSKASTSSRTLQPPTPVLGTTYIGGHRIYDSCRRF